MIYNTMSSNTTVIFMETVPWFLRVYFSSLSIENDGKEIKPCKYSNRSDGSSLISSMGHMFFIHILVATYFPFLHASLLLSCTPCLFSNCLNFTLNNEVCCNNKNFMTVMSQVHLYKTFTDKINFIPAKDRANPYQMELVFRLFANSVTKITYSFERAFLKWTEYPPDANHGFYVSSAVVSTVLPVASQYTATSQSVSLLEER